MGGMARPARVALVVVALSALVAGCGNGTTTVVGSSTTVSDSSVHGRVTAGPTCPVAGVGVPGCDPRPVVGAVIEVHDESGRDLGSATSDAAGNYVVQGITPGSTV